MTCSTKQEHTRTCAGSTCEAACMHGSGLLTSPIARPGPWKSHQSLSAFREVNQWWRMGQAKFLIWEVALGPHEQGQHSQDLLVIPGLLDNCR